MCDKYLCKYSKSFFLSLRIQLLVRNNTSQSTLLFLEIVKKEIFDCIPGARWSNRIKAYPITGLSVNDNVGLALDLVLDQGDHVIIHLV